MDPSTDFFGWLFDSRTGVLVLLVAGIVIALVVAFVMERRTAKMYFNHEKQPGEEDSLLEGLFGGSDDDDDEQKAEKR